jgi:ketosteroid isomerase-like protein
MTDDVRQRIHLLYDAFASGKIGLVADAFHDDVEFVSHAPIELFPYLGRRRGKAAVVGGLIALREQFDIVRLEPLSIIAEDDDAALIVAANVVERDSGRRINVLLSHFLHFRGGLIIDYRAFMDSLNAVRQFFGREVGAAPSA